MEYTNDKIKKLIKERDALIEKYNRKIQLEIEIEKGNYRFDWKRFLFMIAMIILAISAFELNKKIFPPTSIWSWNYYKSK